jgi:hypothetical protein
MSRCEIPANQDARPWCRSRLGCASAFCAACRSERRSGPGVTGEEEDMAPGPQREGGANDPRTGAFSPARHIAVCNDRRPVRMMVLTLCVRRTRTYLGGGVCLGGASSVDRKEPAVGSAQRWRGALVYLLLAFGLSWAALSSGTAWAGGVFAGDSSSGSIPKRRGEVSEGMVLGNGRKGAA